jgi:hypothetical protein
MLVGHFLARRDVDGQVGRRDLEVAGREGRNEDEIRRVGTGEPGLRRRLA